MSARRLRRPNAGRDQRGVTLVEVLVAVAILGLTVTGIAAATSVTTRSAGTSGTIARTDSLLTAFGEAIKNLPYLPCASETNYEGLFQQSEQGLTPERDLTETGATFTVRAVRDSNGVLFTNLNGCTATNDPGEQRIELAVTFQDRSREGAIVKINPAAKPLPSVVTIKPALQSRSGDPQVIVALTADLSKSYTPIYQYQWFCDGQFVTLGSGRPPDFVTSDAIDPSVVCTIEAPTAATTRKIALITTDENGVEQLWTLDYSLPVTPAPHAPPQPDIWITSSVKCYDDGTSPVCPAGSPVQFSSMGPDFTFDAVLAKYQWDFGDGSLPYVSTSQATKNPPAHNFPTGGSFDIKLTVTDSLGAIGTFSIKAKVGGPVVPIPVAKFTATPAIGTAPQTVTFNASASTSVSPITSYSWDFGLAGATASGTSSTRTYPYTQAGTYVVTLTVNAQNGTSAKVQQTVVLNGLQWPINIRNTNHKGDIPFIRNAYFTFIWTNVPSSPGDQVSYQIRLSSAGGFCSGGLGIGANGKVFTVAASGPAGSVQQYTAQFKSNPFAGFNGVCATDDYAFQTQTVRVSGGNTYYSGWSGSTTIPVDFF